MTTRVEWLGAKPADEAATADSRAAVGVCRRYQAAVRLVLGDEPAGAVLRVLPAPPDRTHPFELAVEYDPTLPAAVAFAERCRTSAPSTWAAAGLDAPDNGPGPGRG
jgi:hypothetical protein